MLFSAGPRQEPERAPKGTRQALQGLGLGLLSAARAAADVRQRRYCCTACSPVFDVVVLYGARRSNGTILSFSFESESIS